MSRTRVRPPSVPDLTMTAPNWSGSSRRLCTSSVYWKEVGPSTGGMPTWPAVTCSLCCWSALMTSWASRPRACIFSGSSQMRIEYWPAPNTVTLPTPGSRAISSLSRMVA